MKLTPRPWWKRLWESLAVPVPDPGRVRRRLELVERNLVLPVKAAVILMLVPAFEFSPWYGAVSSTLDVVVESLQYFLWAYVALNIVFGAVRLAMHRLPLSLVQWVVFTDSLVDGVFLSALTLVSGGYDSILFWLLVALIVRNAAGMPPALSQLVLNGWTILFYFLAGVADITVTQDMAERYDEITRRALGLTLPENPTETFLIRLVVMVLTSLCGFAVQVLLEKQRLAREEAQEFSLREGELKSAGRMAAEIAHQIKNPLAIINNAVFSLQKAVREGKGGAEKQMQIIQEEVERSDRIVTELIGYAQLSEGHVEKLSVPEELDRAIAQVFPPAANYPVKIQRDFAGHFPPLLMQRRHLTEVLVNLLQNAREAMDGRGNLFVGARLRDGNTIEIKVRDEGPGIPLDKLEQVFESYYTTKAKGTGLGLAIVKHNVELYGGTVRAESELGKGAQFTVTFPAKILIRSAGTT